MPAKVRDTRSGKAPMTKTKPIVLAVQGGAAHGAFIWGALDKLLEDGRVEIEGVSGTSSGAINAGLLAYGLIGNDPVHAREVISYFWRRISKACEARRWTASMAFRLLRSRFMQISKKDTLFDLMSRILLPYDFDPFTMDPLRSTIGEAIDFERLRAGPAIKLFVNATNIATNKNRVFDNFDITLDAICASCCLPYLFDAVSIEGERYWDGGYMGNPTIYPLVYNCKAADVVMVMTSPLGPRPIPQSSADILSRISQVSFASAFMREMRAITFVTDLLEAGHISKDAGLRKIRMHAIAPPADEQTFSGEESFNVERRFMDKLFEKGRAAASEWLENAFPEVGRQSTLDIKSEFT